MAENTNQTSENQEELSKKDFHELMMKQYELLNSQFSTIRQLQLDNEERSAEFDFSRLIPKFLRRKKDKGENNDNTNNGNSLIARFGKFCLLTVARSFKIVVILTLLGLIAGIVFYATSDKYYVSKIKYSSGALGNQFFAGQIDNLGSMAGSAPEFLAQRLNISVETANKIKQIQFQEFTDYRATKKKMVNDSTFQEYSYYPFFEIVLMVSDNSVLQETEEKITSYLGDNEYISERLATMASGIKSQVEDLSKQIANMDSLTSAAVTRVKNSTENQFFIKETGLDGKGIILNQGEPINGIINTIVKDSRITAAKKGMLMEQLADIANDRFSLVEHFTVSNNYQFPKISSIIVYTLYGLVLGIIVAFGIAIFKLLSKKVDELEKSEAAA